MTLFSIIFWGISPEIVRLGPIVIRWYSLLFALGLILGYEILSWIFRVEHKSQKDLESLTVSLILAVVLGARLGHCLFYEPTFYLANPIKILKVWEGGLASHGAAIGIFVAIFIFIRKRPHISLLWLMDRLAMPVAIAAFCVRLGNFFNSEILGKPSDVAWAVIFTRVDFFPRHPSQLYEAIAYIIIFVLLLMYYKKRKEECLDGMLSGMLLILLFSARFIIEYFKEYQAIFEYKLPIDMGQILSLPFIALGIYLIIRAKNIQRKKLSESDINQTI